MPTAKRTSASSARGKRPAGKRASIRSSEQGSMRMEYNFAGGTRGKYAKKVTTTRLIQLDSDVAAHFTTARSVNAALRTIASGKRRKAG